MTLHSKRFDKDYEVPENMKCVTEDGMIILRSQFARELINELGEAVKLETKIEATTNPIYCVSATIKDDTGFNLTKYGSVNISRESEIPKLFPIETAESRAIANVGIEYFQFDGRVYSDASIAMKEEAPAEPAKQEVPEKYEPKVTQVAPEDDMPDEAPAEEPKKAPAKKSTKKAEKKTEENLGDYTVPVGNAYTKGKKLSELSDTSLNWLAGLKPTTDAAKEAKAKAEAYLASKAK